jgi:hypothetical protein
MPDDPKTARAAEIQKAIEDADKRKRDDANVDLAKERASGGTEGTPLDKMLATLDRCATAMDSMSSRLDALEKHRDDTHRKRDDDRKRDDETESEYQERMNGRSPGEAKQVVADSAATRHALLDAQSRVDQVALRFGQRADLPLHGETLRDYRRRQLRRYQRFSPQYKAADLDSISDEQVWNGVEERIFADACAAADSSDIPPGTLRMRTRVTESGHRINEFYGSCNSWMDRFGGNRHFVRAINPRPKFDK